jgi:ribosomal protein L37AE/L43A
MVIHGSSIQKCSHGVYLASVEEIKADKARYCQFCRPQCNDIGLTVGPAAIKEVVQATKQFTRTSCPRCGSDTHYETSGRNWQCSECGNEWKPPRVGVALIPTVSIRRV